MISPQPAVERRGFISNAGNGPIRCSWRPRMDDRRGKPTEMPFQHLDRQSGRGADGKQYVLIGTRIDARC